ncbi:hypothetical protein BOTBODRAFT_49740 [Botryobasidium botryosum FD-172 SS1]|uniref:Uncharacterized protein n=1 Tax=Botryobasidium botryosum (strain FD-172 SS1) TaxID=930990 RepID=A0A067M1G0_BOTB1|nr:hypothetical protein BOTBODRAFT_49740 [Botryobasidium botryosum FD-172 SS1]
MTTVNPALAAAPPALFTFTGRAADTYDSATKFTITDAPLVTSILGDEFVDTFNNLVDARTARILHSMDNSFYGIGNPIREAADVLSHPKIVNEFSDNPQTVIEMLKTFRYIVANYGLPTNNLQQAFLAVNTSRRYRSIVDSLFTHMVNGNKRSNTFVQVIQRFREYFNLDFQVTEFSSEALDKFLERHRRKPFKSRQDVETYICEFREVCEKLATPLSDIQHANPARPKESEQKKAKKFLKGLHPVDFENIKITYTMQNPRWNRISYAEYKDYMDILWLNFPNLEFGQSLIGNEFGTGEQLTAPQFTRPKKVKTSAYKEPVPSASTFRQEDIEMAESESDDDAMDWEPLDIGKITTIEKIKEARVQLLKVPSSKFDVEHRRLSLIVTNLLDSKPHLKARASEIADLLNPQILQLYPSAVGHTRDNCKRLQEWLKDGWFQLEQVMKKQKDSSIKPISPVRYQPCKFKQGLEINKTPDWLKKGKDMAPDDNWILIIDAAITRYKALGNKGKQRAEPILEVMASLTEVVPPVTAMADSSVVHSNSASEDMDIDPELRDAFLPLADELLSKNVGSTDQELMTQILGSKIQVSVDRLFEIQPALKSRIIWFLKKREAQVSLVHSKGSLLHFHAQVKDSDIDCFLNNGSQVNIVRPSLIQKLGIGFSTDEPITIQDVNNGTKEITGMALIYITINGVRFPGKFFIHEFSGTSDLLLGQPWSSWNLALVLEEVHRTDLLFKGHDASQMAKLPIRSAAEQDVTVASNVVAVSKISVINNTLSTGSLSRVFFSLLLLFFSLQFHWFSFYFFYGPFLDFLSSFK